MADSIKYRKGDKFHITHEWFDPKTVYKAVKDSESGMYDTERVSFVYNEYNILGMDNVMTILTEYTAPYQEQENLESSACICKILDLMRTGCACGFLKRSEATW